MQCLLFGFCINGFLCIQHNKHIALLFCTLRRSFYDCFQKRRMEGWLTNWKQSDHSLIDALSRHLPSRAEENYMSYTIRSWKLRLTAAGIRCADHVTPSIGKKLALASLTSGGRSVGIVRLRTTSHGVIFTQHNKFSIFLHSMHQINCVWLNRISWSQNWQWQIFKHSLFLSSVYVRKIYELTCHFLRILK
jgi:hypothetical protein